MRQFCIFYFKGIFESISSGGLFFAGFILFLREGQKKDNYRGLALGIHIAAHRVKKKIGSSRKRVPPISFLDTVLTI